MLLLQLPFDKRYIYYTAVGCRMQLPLKYFWDLFVGLKDVEKAVQLSLVRHLELFFHSSNKNTQLSPIAK